MRISFQDVSFQEIENERMGLFVSSPWLAAKNGRDWQYHRESLSNQWQVAVLSSSHVGGHLDARLQRRTISSWKVRFSFQSGTNSFDLLSSVATAPLLLGFHIFYTKPLSFSHHFANSHGSEQAVAISRHFVHSEGLGWNQRRSKRRRSCSPRRYRKLCWARSHTARHRALMNAWSCRACEAMLGGLQRPTWSQSGQRTCLTLITWSCRSCQGRKHTQPNRLKLLHGLQGRKWANVRHACKLLHYLWKEKNSLETGRQNLFENKCVCCSKG